MRITKIEKVLFEISNKKIKTKKKLINLLKKEKISKTKIEKIEKHFERYKTISMDKIKNIFDYKGSINEIKYKFKVNEFQKKYKIKKYEKGFFEGSFTKNKNMIYVRLEKNFLKQFFSTQTIKKIEKGQKISNRTKKKIEKIFHNNTTMNEKLAIVELVKDIQKGKIKIKDINEKLFEKYKKKVSKKVDKLKKDLTADKIKGFTIYDFIY